MCGHEEDGAGVVLEHAFDEHLEAQYEERYEDDMEAIPSGEVFPNVELTQAQPPKHTDPEHLACVYYEHEEVYPNGMTCSHGVDAAGGFYSEDYVAKLRHQVHRLLGFLDRNVELTEPKWSRNGKINSKYVPDEELIEFHDSVEILRGLTK